MMANIVYTTQSYSNAVPVRSFCDLLDMTENFNNEFTLGEKSSIFENKTENKKIWDFN